MPSVMTVRNVPDEVRRVLAARAASRGESLNSYLLWLLRRDAARPTAAEVFERAARRGGSSAVCAVEVLNAAREER